MPFPQIAATRTATATLARENQRLNLVTTIVECHANMPAIALALPCPAPQQSHKGKQVFRRGNAMLGGPFLTASSVRRWGRREVYVAIGIGPFVHSSGRHQHWHPQHEPEKQDAAQRARSRRNTCVLTTAYS